MTQPFNWIRVSYPVLFCWLLCAAAPAEEPIVAASGVKGGLVVHLGCGDGRQTASLHGGESFLVHGLDTDPENIEQARTHIHSLGLYGQVSVDVYDGARLPYVDNLVNLIVAADLGDVPRSEVLRVLAPRGVAMIGGERIVKPWPETIDEWTHFLHGADNNALAEDRVVGPPRHMQWLAGPRWTRHHDTDKGTYPTIRAVVSARGRLFYLVDQTKSSDQRVPSEWFLIARDAFSGVQLWKTPVESTTFERRLEQVWRSLIADGDRVYVALGADQPLSALDGATGLVVRSYKGTAGFQEVIKSDDDLLVISRDNRVLSLNADTGRLRWQWAPPADDSLVPLTMAAAEGQVFVKTEQSVCCLAGEQGRVVWRTPLDGPQKKTRLRFPHEKLLVKDGIVLCSFGGNDPRSLNLDRFAYLGSHPRVHEYGGKLAALSAADGRLLWQTEYLPGLESMPGEIYVSAGRVWLGPAFATARDLRSGEIVKDNPVLDRLWTTGHHYRCYPGKATSKYVITAKRGIELFDLEGDNHSRNNWVRGTCRVGVTPCNGLLYAPPHSCGCYMEAKLYGFWALAAARDPSRPIDATGQFARQQQGPAYGQAAGPGTAENAAADAWPTYRHDAARSGSTESAIAQDLEPLWTTQLGGPLSAVTVAGGKLFVAQVEAHTVHALDAETGRPLWQFTAGGRVDSPPTLYGEQVLFGSRDGWVYCLRAADGALVWRFLAAHRLTNSVAYEQVESLWPVHGSVLIQDGIAYVAAGRSSYLDEGLVLYGLDPATGKQVCTHHVLSEHAGLSDPPAEEERARMATEIRQNNTDYKTFQAPDQSDAFSMRGAIADVLVADGDSVFMRHQRFDRQLVPREEKRSHFFSTSSLLDDSEHHRSYWVMGTGDFSRTPVAYPWIVSTELAVPYGLQLVFDDATVWGVHRALVGKRRTSGYAVFARPRPDVADEESQLPDFAARPGSATSANTWVFRIPLRPRALLRAGNQLVIGGHEDLLGEAGNKRLDKAPPAPTNGLLHFVSADDGQRQGAATIPAPPVWDGMAVAGGRLFAALEDGSVICLGP